MNIITTWLFYKLYICNFTIPWNLMQAQYSELSKPLNPNFVPFKIYIKANLMLL